ncbi:tyrosine-type recombinase/integrase, partial [Brevundimonas sp.]|uniref:tyrosine-type recombinase/integrase n=1 Tax=Brevundimonas sp. TaxID=1871086 RepID=UPI0039191220
PRGSAAVRARLTGLHKATKRLSGGRVAVYAYACRGGPLVARGEGRDLTAANEALEKALGSSAALEAIQKARQPIRQRDDRRYVRGLIYAFKASPEWDKLGKSSKVEYTRYLNAFDAEFGDWRVSLFEKPEAKVDLLDWRDEWADRPRAADYAMASVGRLFKWARGRGLSSAKPTEDIERLHSADRSNVIWTDDDLTRILAHAGREVGWAIRFAAETGLRLGDLIRLPWNAVGASGIVWTTGKRKRQVVVPLTPAAKVLLAEMPTRALTVLANSRGEPWTEGGLKHMIREARIAAGITGLRLHDLRGTAATRLFLAGSPKRDIATIMGWSEQVVDALLTKYVSGDAVALDLLSRMNQKPAPQTDDKPVSAAKT